MSETRAQYGEAPVQGQVQHTPGPWKVRVDDYHGGMTVTDESGRSCVAMFPRYWLAHDEANAALIAAAPDLLAALVEMESVFLRLGADPDSVDWDDDDRTGERWRMVRTAIARATAAPAAEREG